MSTVQRKEAGVKGRGTEVGSDTDVCEAGKIYIVSTPRKVRLNSYRRSGPNDGNRLTVPRAHGEHPDTRLG